LMCHLFLMCDFTGVKSLPVRYELFRPKLNSNGLSGHTISWHYPFKRKSWYKHFPFNLILQLLAQLNLQMTGLIRKERIYKDGIRIQNLLSVFLIIQ
jgi:hypothetical protein